MTQNNRHRLARLQPRLELFEAPVVHADLAAAAALAATHEDRPPPRVEVKLREIERLLDSQTGAPEHDDQRACPRAVHAVAAAAHDRDDLLSARWVGWVAAALAARRSTREVPGNRRRRATAAKGIQRR
jgi:hypothetical protein